MTTITTEKLPPITCTTWCEVGDGHPDEWHPADQWCHSRAPRVSLTRMPLRSYEGHQWLDNLKVYLARERDGATYVNLSRDDKQGVEMTLAEVRELRDNLTALLVMAAVQA